MKYILFLPIEYLMKLNNSIGIYITNHPKINSVIDYCRHTYSDLVLFTNYSHNIPCDLTVLPKFYARFFQGDVLYFTYEEFLHNSNNSLQKHILYVDNEEISKLDLKAIKKHKILFYQDDKLIMKDYENELQQLIR